MSDLTRYIMFEMPPNLRKIYLNRANNIIKERGNYSLSSLSYSSGIHCTSTIETSQSLHSYNLNAGANLMEFNGPEFSINDFK